MPTLLIIDQTQCPRPDLPPSGLSPPCSQAPTRSSTKATKLARITHAFSQSEGISDALYLEFSSAWFRIFPPGTEAVIEQSTPRLWDASISYRLHRLRQADQNIRRGDWVARRLWQILLSHEVEYISHLQYAEDRASKGVSALSVTLTQAMEYLPNVHNNYKKSSYIVRIITEQGPASVLQNGNIPSSE